MHGHTVGGTLLGPSVVESRPSRRSAWDEARGQYDPSHSHGCNGTCWLEGVRSASLSTQLLGIGHAP